MKQNKLFKIGLLAVILLAGSGVTWGAVGDLIYNMDLAAQSSAFGTSNAYGAKTGTVSSVTWYANAGSCQSTSAVWLGTNSDANRTSYTKLSSGVNGRGGAIANALGISTSDVGYYAIVASNPITNVGSIKVKAATTGGTAPGTLWCLYSTDNGTTYTVLGSINSPGTSEQTFTPSSTIASAQYAFVFYSSAWGTFRTPYFKFYEGATGSTPTITVTETSLSGFTYEHGSGPSNEQSFKFSGANLTNDISISAPTNYEISKTSGTGYASPLTFTQSGGTISEQTVYVRLKAGLSAANYNNENITLSSTGATDKTVSCSGSVTSPPVTPSVSIAITSGNNPTCAGSSVTFTATPTNTGGGSVSYQWKVNSTNTGTNSATFTSTTLANNDQVSCVITITGGNVTTNTATSGTTTMTVNALPATPTAGNNGPVCIGGTLNLTSDASGSISWTGPNGFTSTLQNPQITNVTSAAAGTYYVTSNNGSCTSLSGSTVVTINAATSITTQPVNATVTVGGSTTFNVVATGSGLTYQWRLNGSNIIDATADSYTINNVTLGMSGNIYSVVVTGNCGSPITSDNANLTVVELPCGGTESFTNHNLSGSTYTSGSFTGDVVTWSYVYCRDESTYGITGKGCMLGSSNTAKLTSGSLSGIGNFTCKLKKGFTGTGTRQVALYINGELKGTSVAWDNTTTQTFTVNDINVTGNVVIEIRNLTNYQAVVDDISWTCYAPPSAPVANDALNTTTSGFTANWKTVSGSNGFKLDVSTQNPFSSDVTIVDENFVKFTGNGTAVSVLDDYMTLSGWTGSQVYTYNGAARLGSGSNKGIITTPTINLSNAESVKLTFDLQDYGTDGSSIEVFHAADGATFNSVTTLTAPGTMTTQTVYFTGGTANSKIRIQGVNTSNNRFYIDNFKVVKTVSNCLSSYKDLTVNALSQTVTGLTNHTTYYYRVRAVGANGTSTNSNVISVYTGENYRSKTNGNWNDVSTWEVSSDNNTWIDATEIPSTTSATVTVQDGQKVEIVSNTNINSLIVKPTGKLTLKNNFTLGTQTINIQSDNTGTGTYVDENSGTGLPAITGTVNQYLITDRNWYLSSPVSAAAVPAADNVWYYDETVVDANPLASWKNPTGNLAVGKGYIVNPTGSAVSVQFNGTLNSGDKTVTLTKTTNKSSQIGFNLVGNPYPSYIDAATLLSVNRPTGSEKVENNIWYRTHTGSAYQFQTYNASGDINVPLASNGAYIPPLQAFWVRALTNNAELNFTNAMRKHNDTENSILLRAPKAPVADRQLIRLQVSNGTVIDELVIYSNANASNGFDAYDSPKMLNGSASLVPDLYTTAGSEKLVINGMNSLPLDVLIPVSFVANNATTTQFTISANEISNIPSGITLKIVDNGIETSLSNGGTYTFTADTGTGKSLGLILRSPGTVTGLNNQNIEECLVYTNSNHQIVVNAANASIVNVYNITGQHITQKTMNGTSLFIDVPTAGVYLVSVENKIWKVITR